jgi:hypothetical protein
MHRLEFKLYIITFLYRYNNMHIQQCVCIAIAKNIGRCIRTFGCVILSIEQFIVGSIIIVFTTH